MAEPTSSPDRQRRLAGYVFAGVGLINLVVGLVVGAVVTTAVSVVMLVVGGALVLSGRPRGGGAAG
jgi:hypothetical protein